MKKIVLIIVIVLCLAVAGTALALSFNDAQEVSGVLQMDSVLEMRLNSSASASVRLTQGVPSVYPLVCDIYGSQSAPKNVVGTLTITLMDTIVFSMDQVSVAVYSDAECQSLLPGKTQTGAGTITIENISSQTTYYVSISVPGDLEDVTGVGGTIRFTFNRQA